MQYGAYYTNPYEVQGQQPSGQPSGHGHQTSHHLRQESPHQQSQQQPYLQSHLGQPQGNNSVYNYSNNSSTTGPPMFAPPPHPSAANPSRVHGSGSSNNGPQPIAYSGTPFHGYAAGPLQATPPNTPPLYHQSPHPHQAHHLHTQAYPLMVPQHPSQDLQQLFVNQQANLLMHQRPSAQQSHGLMARQHHPAHLMPTANNAGFQASANSFGDHLSYGLASSQVNNTSNNLTSAASMANGAGSLAHSLANPFSTHRSQAPSTVSLGGGGAGPITPLVGASIEGDPQTPAPHEGDQDASHYDIVFNHNNSMSHNTFGASANSVGAVAQHPMQQGGEGQQALLQRRKKEKKVPSAIVDLSIIHKFKTKLCGNMETHGTCPYRGRCMFAHGSKELRTPEENLRDSLTSEAAIETFKADIRARKAARDMAQQQRSDPISSPGGHTEYTPAFTSRELPQPIMGQPPVFGVMPMQQLQQFQPLYQQQPQQPPQVYPTPPSQHIPPQYQHPSLLPPQQMHHHQVQHPHHHQQQPPYYHQQQQLMVADANAAILQPDANDAPA
eukprot:GILJ01019674.1.p1 GENE.GILJ01019674.1~~GILJ01019674.1.p1  ORF type:complete len:554 (+),score=78.43 GILJ01019674.1:431-2092(+)